MAIVGNMVEEVQENYYFRWHRLKKQPMAMAVAGLKIEEYVFQEQGYL